MNGDTETVQAVVGATGYIGERLVRRLAAEGGRVRALAREPGRLEPLGGVETAAVDLLRPAGLERALAGCEVAYYLVHSMEPGEEDFSSREQRSAEAFAAAALAAGVDRVVYLGGLAPLEGAPSAHLASRLAVEAILLASLPRSTALRASIVVGAGSPSFRILVRLIERLFMLPLPAWGERRTRPIDERDVIDYLALTPHRPEAAGRALDIAGPDEVSYVQLIDRIAEAMGVARLPIDLPARSPSTAGALVAALSHQPLELVRPLMESLEHDLLPRDEDAARVYRLRPRPLARAIEHALGEWEAREVLAAR